MANDLYHKLELTLLALGCRTRKELLSRILEVNATTSFSPERAYKWMRGVAAPRDRQVYSDLAAVLGLDEGGGFYETSSFEDFARAACRVHPTVRSAAEEKLGRTLLPGTDASSSDDAEALSVPPAHVIGRFMCFSPAWSVARTGAIIAGILDIGSDSDRQKIVYREDFGSDVHVYSGRIFRTGKVLHSTVVANASEIPLYFCFQVPSSPSVCLTGVFAGAAVVDPISRPCACRIFGIRIDENAAQVDEMMGYYASDGHELPCAIQGLGFEAEASDALARLIHEGLQAPASQGLLDMTFELTTEVTTLLYMLREGRA